MTAVSVPAASADARREACAPPTQRLAARPFAPTDVALFNQQIYPAAPDAQPAPAPGQSAQTRADLRAYLKRQVPDSPARVAAGLALFDSPLVAERITHPTLRAAVASLLGTVAEPAILTLLDPNLFGSVRFVPFVGQQATLSAKVFLPAGATQPEIQFNSRFEFEHFTQFSALLVHETLHSDVVVTPLEEMAALAIEPLVHAEVLLAWPRAALAGTELARRNNSKLMARLNSGLGSRLGLFAANGPTIFPGGPTLASFSALFVPIEGASPTPGNALLRALVRRLAERGATMPPRADFDETTLAFLDANHRALTSAELVQVARTLKLAVACR